MLEYAWPRTGLVTWDDPDDYRRIVEFLDAAPPGLQVTAGRWVLSKRQALKNGHEQSSGMMLLGDRLLVYLCSSEAAFPDPEEFAAELYALTTTRCEEYSEVAGRHVDTLGIGVLVLDGKGQDYSYQLLLGPRRVPTRLRRSTEWRYGTPNFRLGTTKHMVVERNEPCPCLSGRKFKLCHGR